MERSVAACLLRLELVLMAWTEGSGRATGECSTALEAFQGRSSAVERSQTADFTALAALIGRAVAPPCSSRLPRLPGLPPGRGRNVVSVETRIRELVAAGGGRVAVETVAQDALGLPGAKGPMARKLAESAVAALRGLALEGDEVVARARKPAAGRAFAVTLAVATGPTLLPPLLAWSAVPRESAEPAVVPLDGADWRERLRAVGAELAGGTVLALTAGSVRRVLRLAAQLAELDVDEEPEVVALAPVARALGHPIRSAEEAASLVGEAVPDTPQRAARVLAELGSFLADKAGRGPVDLAEIAAEQVLPPFEFGERAFGREEVLALPDSPGVYLFEDAEGAVAYVGKSKTLRKRVASYFLPEVDERATRVREAAHGLSHERTGTELSALLREHELIRDLAPAQNVATQVHARGREQSGGLGSSDFLAVVQPSADGGAEVVLLERKRGVRVLQVVPVEEEERDIERQLLLAIVELLEQPADPESDSPEVEIALSWLADHGAEASIVDASGEPDEVAALLLRLARDPDLQEGRIVPQ